MKNPCIKCINKWLCFLYAESCWKKKIFLLFKNLFSKNMKAANRRTALELKHDYEIFHNNSYESGLQVVPMKETYEW